MWKYNYVNTTELYHYGVLGMKWGIRRYQNEDGTLTEKGKKRITNRLGKNNNTNYNLPNFIRRKIFKDNVETYAFLRKNNFITDSDVEKHKQMVEKASESWDDFETIEMDFANNRKMSFANNRKMSDDEYIKILKEKYKEFDDILNEAYSNIQNLSVNFVSTDPDFKDKRVNAIKFLDHAMIYDDKYYKKKGG